MLNSQQRKAVETIHGKILVLAGAGSGKTSVITHRIAYLVCEKKIPPTAILGLTFTNKAAQEMKKRLTSLIRSTEAKLVSICTFHSFCMHVLRKEIEKLGYTKNFSLYGEKEVRRLVTQLARQLLEHEGDLPSLETTLETISQAKNKAISPKELEGSGFAKDLFERLQTCMRAYNAVDFDSLLSLTLQLFTDHPEVLSVYQNLYQYVMIDEYQDTNPIQYKIASLLTEKHKNLCVVGDDDQAIYGWRGADIQNILQFPSDTLIKLEQNYRSTPTILQAAHSVVRQNKERHEKELWSNKEKGDPLQLFHAPTDAEEAEAVVDRMITLHQERSIPWKEMAVLYRSNILSRPLETALLQASWKKENQWVRGIPYQVFGGTEFYERSEIKDLVAYLRVIFNPLDQEALLRIINVPRRGISDQTLDKLTQYNRLHNLPLWDVLQKGEELSLPDKALQSIHHFVHLIQEAKKRFAKPPYSSTLSWLVDTISYSKAIAEEVKSEKMRSFKGENVQAFIETIRQWEEKESGKPLSDFIDILSLDTQSWNPADQEKDVDAVNLMTFHSAKGLEFRVCFLVGLEDHIIPHEKSSLEGRLEEERRLLYVAMTRAKEALFLSMARQRKRYGKDTPSNPSRFLFTIPKELVEVVSWKF